MLMSTCYDNIFCNTEDNNDYSITDNTNSDRYISFIIQLLLGCNMCDKNFVAGKTGIIHRGRP